MSQQPRAVQQRTEHMPADGGVRGNLFLLPLRYGTRCSAVFRLDFFDPELGVLAIGALNAERSEWP
jgi:hypothetical protein